MRLLITGSSGFIGSHLVVAALKRSALVAGVDTAPTALRHESFTHLSCDILEAEKLRAIFSQFQPDHVVHLAATHDISTPVNENLGLAGYRVNTDGTANLIAAIRDYGRVRRAVFTSTQLVSRIGHVPANDQDYHPSTYYGRSKLIAERMIREQQGGGTEWVIVRPTTVWGPGMMKHYQRFLELIKQGRYIHTGRRQLFKTYGYVGNIATQYCELLTAPAEQVHEKVFYLADYDPLSLRAYADALAHEMDAPPIRTIPEPLMWAAAKAGDVLNYCGWSRFPLNSFRLTNILTEYQVDMVKTQEVCGRLPYTFEEGIRETVAWFLTVRPGGDVSQRGGLASSSER